VAHHVLRAELREGDAAHALEDAPRLDQPALLAAREVDLGDVAVHHRLGAEADAREEHLHLLRRGVLRLVEDDERVIQRAPAHVGERRDLDRAALEHALHLVESHQVVERVVQRPQVRIDLLREVAREEPEALARLDRRPHQHDALHRVALERVHRAGDREVGLAGAGRPDAEGHVVAEDVAEVVALVRGATVQVGAPRLQHRLVGLVAIARTLRLDQAELDVVDRELALRLGVELFQELGRARRATGVAAHRETVAAARDRHLERDLDLAQVLVERAAQAREALVVRGRERQLDGLRLQGRSGRSGVAHSDVRMPLLRAARARPRGPPRGGCAVAPPRRRRRQTGRPVAAARRS
jgi:hypothetical protein